MGCFPSTTSISIRAAAYNDPPLITGEADDILIKEDSDWLFTAIRSVGQGRPRRNLIREGAERGARSRSTPSRRRRR